MTIKIHQPWCSTQQASNMLLRCDCRFEPVSYGISSDSMVPHVLSPEEALYPSLSHFDVDAWVRDMYEAGKV